MTSLFETFQNAGESIFQTMSPIYNGSLSDSEVFSPTSETMVQLQALTSSGIESPSEDSEPIPPAVVGIPDPRNPSFKIDDFFMKDDGLIVGPMGQIFDYVSTTNQQIQTIKDYAPYVIGGIVLLMVLRR